MNTYKTLQIVRSQFLTDKLIFVNIRYNLNIYWFISIWIHCQQIQTDSYWVTFHFFQYSVSYSMSDNEGNSKLFTIT